MTNKSSQTLLIAGGLLTVVGAVGQFLAKAWSPYVFGIGAITIIVLQGLHISNIWNGDQRQRRLSKIAFMSSLLLAAGTYFMFVGSNSWVVALLSYSTTTIFLSYRAS